MTSDHTSSRLSLRRLLMHLPKAAGMRLVQLCKDHELSVQMCVSLEELCLLLDRREW